MLATETPLKTNKQTKTKSFLNPVRTGLWYWNQMLVLPFVALALVPSFYANGEFWSALAAWRIGNIRSFTASECTVKDSTVNLFLSLLPPPPHSPPTTLHPPAHCPQWRMKLEEEEENVLIISVAWWHLCNNKRGERARREGCREIERDGKTETERDRDRQTETDTNTDRNRDRQTDTDKDTNRERERESRGEQLFFVYPVKSVRQS